MSKARQNSKTSIHQAASLQQPSAPSSCGRRPSCWAFSPSMMDALSTPPQTRVMAPDEIRQKFGPAQTLGAPDNVRMAMDNALEDAGFYTLLQHSLEMGVYGGMANFMGYAQLQNIAQNGLIRACIETVSDDMTRNWIELTREGEKEDKNKNGKDDVLDALTDALDALDMQRVFHEACSKVGYYGGCLIFLDTGVTGDRLKNPLNLDPLFSMEARDRGFLKALRVIDPINLFPGTYNATNPLAADYYKPKTWWVLGQEVHASRFVRLVANEAPLIFKPSYNFMGIPQAQILWDYVLHFQANRDAANRLLNKFSMLVFKTSMADILQGIDGLATLDTRMQILARNQSNDGVFAIDRENEDVVKVETPIGGVTDIVKQSLEQLAAMNRTPAVKLLGISPSGFNATGESDLRNYYDHVLSQQEKVLRQAIKDILDVVQISETGKLDDSIDFTFNPLSEEDKNSVAMTQQVKANTICSLLDRDIISPEEARRALISDPSSGFNDLDPDDVPEPKDEQGMGGMGGMMGGIPGLGGAPEAEGEGQEGAEGEGRPDVSEKEAETDASEEMDEIKLGRRLLGMDGGSEGKRPFDGAQDEDIPEDKIAGWFSTENGSHIPIAEGETKTDAMERQFDKPAEETAPKGYASFGEIKNSKKARLTDIKTALKKAGITVKGKNAILKDGSTVDIPGAYDWLTRGVVDSPDEYTQFLAAGKKRTEREQVFDIVSQEVLNHFAKIDAFFEENYPRRRDLEHLAFKLDTRKNKFELSLIQERLDAGKYSPSEEYPKPANIYEAFCRGNKEKAERMKAESEEKIKAIPKMTIEKFKEMDLDKYVGDIRDAIYNDIPSTLNIGSAPQYCALQLGINGKPTVVSKNEFKKIIQKDGAVVLFRGVKAIKRNNYEITPEDMFTDLKHGDHTFYGKGWFGDGIYFTNRKSTALMYAGDNRHGVMAATIDFDKAKVFTIDESEHIGGPEGRNDSLSLLQKGYNVIEIKKHNPGVPEYRQEKFYVVLDRSVLVVPEE